MNHKIIQGDSLEVLKTLEPENINCCITSPPYWGLRDYGTGKAQIGLESTPQEYVEKMVAVFAEVKRLLRKDGTLWLNLGDSYARNGGGVESKMNTVHKMGVGQKSTYLAGGMQTINKVPFGYKEKDLVGIPWRVAFALQADGWYLRQDIIWHKPNPMPESVTDRCTKAHEYIFLLSKSANYHFDSEAIKEDSVWDVDGTGTIKRVERQKEGMKSGPTEMKNGIRIKYPNGKHGDGQQSPKTIYGKRNKRSVWSVNVKPYKEAHFATFPAELITPCVLAGCPKDGTILDPFGGSGTTAEVALENKRNAILIELNPEYIKLAEKRISVVQPKLFV
jgi:DNA modification methylase